VFRDRFLRVHFRSRQTLTVPVRRVSLVQLKKEFLRLQKEAEERRKREKFLIRGKSTHSLWRGILLVISKFRW
jgi:hypothetical protein